MGLTDRDLIFNGHNLSDFLIIEDIDPTTGPSTNPRYDPFGNVIGATIATRMIRITGWLIRKGGRRAVHEAARELFSKLYTTKRAPLYQRDDPDRYEMAILADQPQLDYVGRQGHVSLTFNLEKASYGMTRVHKLKPCSGKWECIFYPGGTYKTFPIIDLEDIKRGDTVRIDHYINGKRKNLIEITNLSPTPILTIDSKIGTVKDMTGARPQGDMTFDSSWIELIPQSKNELFASHKAKVTWTERWL